MICWKHVAFHYSKDVIQVLITVIDSYQIVKRRCWLTISQISVNLHANMFVVWLLQPQYVTNIRQQLPEVTRPSTICLFCAGAAS